MSRADLVQLVLQRLAGSPHVQLLVFVLGAFVPAMLLAMLGSASVDDGVE